MSTYRFSSSINDWAEECNVSAQVVREIIVHQIPNTWTLAYLYYCEDDLMDPKFWKMLHSIKEALGRLLDFHHEFKNVFFDKNDIRTMSIWLANAGIDRDIAVILFNEGIKRPSDLITAEAAKLDRIHGVITDEPFSRLTLAMDKLRRTTHQPYVCQVYIDSNVSSLMDADLQSSQSAFSFHRGDRGAGPAAPHTPPRNGESNPTNRHTPPFSFSRNTTPPGSKTRSGSISSTENLTKNITVLGGILGNQT